MLCIKFIPKALKIAMVMELVISKEYRKKTTLFRKAWNRRSWISPMYPSPGVDNGYDVSDYYGIDPMYGTMEDMKNLIRECENHNIKIIIDLVVNHTSDEHEWFIEAKLSKNSTYRDYYIWRKE